MIKEVAVENPKPRVGGSSNIALKEGGCAVLQVCHGHTSLLGEACILSGIN